jgi:predicted CXXCH cytochrome family protein
MRPLMKWLLSFLLLAGSLVVAQGIDGTLTSRAPASQLTLFDQIDNLQERALFRQAWDAPDPLTQKNLILRFVEQYPGSIVLREAYELAARSWLALGEDRAGLDWARRSLRLMPENPFLLVMIAEVAARQKQLDLAQVSAADALAYLARAETPVPLTPDQWPRVRTDLQATAHFVLGRVAATQGRYADAEAALVESLSLRPDDLQTVFVLGLARMELKDDPGAAAAFSHVMRTNTVLSSDAQRWLRMLYDRSRSDSKLSFDAYASSLTWSPPVARPPLPNVTTPGQYAGSGACRECHTQQYESWRSTGMSKMLRAYRAADIIGDFSGKPSVSGQAKAIIAGGRHFIELKDGLANRWTRYSVDYVIGSKWQQAYATRLPDARILVLPVQYSRVKSAWLNYWEAVDGPRSPRAEISRFHEIPENAVYENTCASCHTSQLKYQSGAPAGERVTFGEGGVNCEMCHGPSLDHVRAKKGDPGPARLGEAIELPIRFGRIPAAASVAICAQCHAQSAVHEALPSGAVNFSDAPGPFYRTYATHLPSNFSRTAFYRDGRHRATTFISEAFSRSQCYRKGGATCASCHNPHPADPQKNPTSLKFLADRNQMCVQCHTTLGEQPERHTRHPAGSQASLCESCHMPRIMDALLFPARSHQIDDVPDAEMTARFGVDGSPNACLSCHRDRDVAWLQREIRAF